MTDPACCIHYKNIKYTDHLIRTSQTTLDTLIENKNIRVNLGGENHHPEQCCGIPDSKEQHSELFYHRKCYQKFTYAKALLKRKNVKDEESGMSSKRQRLIRNKSLDPNEIRPRGLFPSICMICKKKSIKINNKRQPLTKVMTKTAEMTLKAAAQAWDDKDMIASVHETDLIAKEFQKHEKCYREYTRIVRESVSQSKNDEDDPHGNIDVVLFIIEKDVLQGQQCLSVETLMKEYSGHSGSRQGRYKLKDRVLRHYGEKLIFLKPEYHAPELVISKECLSGQIYFKKFSSIQRIHCSKSCSASTREYSGSYRTCSHRPLAANS